MSKRTREEASPPRPTRTARDHRPSPVVERTQQPPVPAIQNATDTDADSMALIAALLAEDGGRRTRTSVHLPVPINRERDHGHTHSRPDSSSRHTIGSAPPGHHHNSDASTSKSDKKSRDRDRSSRESRPDPLQLSSMPAADAALKSPAPLAAAESSEPKARSDRDRDRKRNGSSSSSKRRQEPKKTVDTENVDAAVDDSQMPLNESEAQAQCEAQAPKRVRRPVAASELAALNVDPKALESLASDHGDNDDDETPKMMLRLRKRHDKDEKKEEHGDASKAVTSSALAPSTPDAHHREDGDVRPKDSSRRRSEGGDSKGGGSDRKSAPRRIEGDKSGQEKKDGSHKDSHKSGGSSKKRRESTTPKCVEVKKQEEQSESDGEDDADKWVSCDRCKKWRKLPPAAEMPPKDKKVKWFCEMNILDPARANCSVAEEQWNVSGASVNTTNVDSKHNTMGSSPAAMAAKNQAAKNAAVLGKNVSGPKSGNGSQGKSNSSANLNFSANSVAETLLLYNSFQADSSTKETSSAPLSSNKHKAKGSNIGDAIVELLLYDGIPASVIEARLVDVKKLEPGAVGNQNKLSRSLQKLQRAGILSKERHPGTDEEQNVYTLAQEDLPDLLLSNHDAFFGKLNLLQPPPAALASFPSITTAAAAAVTSPKLASKKAPAKGPIMASPLCSPPSTPRLMDVAATASAAAAGIVELKLESGHVETASVMEEAAALSMNETFQPLPPVSEDRLPSSIETQD